MLLLYLWNNLIHMLVDRQGHIGAILVSLTQVPPIAVQPEWSVSLVLHLHRLHLFMCIAVDQVFLCWMLSLQFMRSLFISIQIYKNSLQALQRMLPGAVANSLLLQCQFANYKVYNISLKHSNMTLFCSCGLSSPLCQNEVVLRMSADIQS